MCDDFRVITSNTGTNWMRGSWQSPNWNAGSQLPKDAVVTAALYSEKAGPVLRTAKENVPIGHGIMQYLVPQDLPPGRYYARIQVYASGDLGATIEVARGAGVKEQVFSTDSEHFEVG